MASPQIVIAAPLFNKAPYLGETLESLLSQTREDFVLLLVDDASNDDSAAIARRYAERDSRVEVHVNPRRLGLLENTRRAFFLARERYPDAPYWALGSDHDRWRPRFLQELAALLDAEPDVLLAYPATVRIDEHGEQLPDGRRRPQLDTRGLETRERFATAFRQMAAGNAVYGLFRARALEGLEFYRAVVAPDRLLLAELALRGHLAPVPDPLWERRFQGLASAARQRAAFWPHGPPVAARLPWWAQHAGALLVGYAIRGEGRAVGIGRRAGVGLALHYLELCAERRLRSRRHDGAERLERLARRWARQQKITGRRLRTLQRRRRVLVRRWRPRLGAWLGRGRS